MRESKVLLEAERWRSPAAGSGSGDWVGRGRGSLLLSPGPTEPCGTVSVFHGSPVGTMRRFRSTGIPPPSPALGLHRWPCALWLDFPTSASDDHSGTLGLSPRRPSRSAHPPHVSALREAVHSCQPRPPWAGLDSPRSLRPAACQGDASPWRFDAWRPRPSMDRWALDCRLFRLRHVTRVLPRHEVSVLCRARL